MKLLLAILAALPAAASFAADWRPAQSSILETPDKRERRFITESGVSFLYRDGMVARAYRDGAKEVVFLGDNDFSGGTIPAPADFHAQPVMRLELTPKKFGGDGAAALDAMARSLAGVSASTESLSESWPPGSFVVRDRKTGRPYFYHSQTKNRWVDLSLFGPNDWELDLMRRGLSESLEDKSREEGLRDPLPKVRVRALPKEGIEELNEFEGATGLRFKFKASWVYESRVREGVERVWLHPRFGFDPVRVNAAAPADFRRPENFSKMELVLVEAAPKKAGRSLAGLRDARIAELSREGVEFSTRTGGTVGSPEGWPADTFAVEIVKPYELREFYTQNDGYLIRYASGAGDESRGISYSLQDHVADFRPRIASSIPEPAIEPRGLPWDPAALILVVLGFALARRRGRPELSRIGLACAAVVCASFAGAAVAGRMPGHLFLGAGLEHALAFAAFGLAIADEKFRRKAALAGAAAGFIQGMIFGWAPMAWAYFNAGGGPGSALLTHIGFFYADLGPVLLLPLNLWTQALVGTLVIAVAAPREERFRRAAGSLALTSLPLLLLPVVSLFIVATAAFLGLFRSIPAQQGAVVVLCLCGAFKRERSRAAGDL